ncbi:MAG: hypothetical protein COT28_16895 [Methylobacterium sp. CG08_land_8_20_14_0_20_71_15]|nr:MAG: hypothetical protein COT56_08775 [Methylobacterium sp. CG09_land_8_20_14_0_10_71_15]PIU12107.1 MAG: hypothetical protein COT28_16895 [Methylobacterium sp. CG08_land_8_20_14_0_20_71_15]GBU19687.1 hypothetical protein AwMethylo_39020 [Methylobacterium sp.]
MRILRDASVLTDEEAGMLDAGLHNLGRTLAARDAFRTAGQPIEAMTTSRIRDELATMEEHRRSETYSLLPAWAEHVEDRVDELEDELERRGARSRLGR